MKFTFMLNIWHVLILKIFYCIPFGQALFQASENLVKRMSSVGYCGKKITLHKKLVTSICEVGGYFSYHLKKSDRLTLCLY